MTFLSMLGLGRC